MALQFLLLLASLHAVARVEPPDGWEQELPGGTRVRHYRMTPERKKWLDEQLDLDERRRSGWRNPSAPPPGTA